MEQPPQTQTVIDLDGAHLLPEEAGKSWSSGIFACLSDADSCCLSCWCPCIQFGQNQERGFRSQHRSCCRWAFTWAMPFIAVYFVMIMLQSATARCEHVCPDGEDALADDVGPHHVPDCYQMCSFPEWMGAVDNLLWICSLFAVAVIAGRRRALLRNQHQIKGSLSHDVACHCCCGCCSLAQEARQIAHEEARALRAQPNGVPIAGGGHTAAVAAVAEPANPYAQPYGGTYTAAGEYGYGAEGDAAPPPALAQPMAQSVYDRT